ncbi:helix-turn-helix domain-containing protein [Pectinatus frisingensis]|uniref:helix-turn-helix domain-containing protein n=1 Tax=Pectinatus frisingensis TaxID=865 RepID=UPI003D805BE3
MDIKNRIRDLRKEQHLTQSEFAEKIGMGQAGLSAIEQGIRNITERNIMLICERFNVRREWLEKGIEPIYKETINSVLDEACKELNLDHIEKQFLAAYLAVPEETRQHFKTSLKQILENYHVINEEKIETVTVQSNHKLTTEEKRQIMNEKFDAEEKKSSLQADVNKKMA